MSALAAGPRHFAAVAVGGGRGLHRAHHRRLCAHPRAVPSADRQASRRSRNGSAAWPPPPICSTPRGASPCAGLDMGHHPAVVTADHERPGDRTAARLRQRRHGHARRQGHDRRPAELSRRALSRGADRHHGRRRQHRHARADPVRPGLDPQPSLSCSRKCWRSKTPTASAGSTLSTRRSGPMSATASSTPAAPWGAPGPAACSPRRPTPDGRRRYYRQLGRYAAAFALCVDMALLTLGGALKRKEMISARFADILSELYLLSAVLKRWQDEGRQEADFPLVEYSHAGRLCHHGAAVRRDSRQPAAAAGGLAAALHGAAARPAPPRPDRRDHAAPAPTLLMEPSATRDRLTAGIYRPTDDRGVARLNTRVQAGRRGAADARPHAQGASHATSRKR